MSEEAEAVSLVLVTNKPLSACFYSIFQLSGFFLHCSLQVSCQFLSFLDSFNIAIVDFKKSTTDNNSPKCFGAWTTTILLLFFFNECAACRCVCIVTGYVGATNGSCYAGKRQRSSQRSRHVYVHRVSTHTVHVMRMH